MSKAELELALRALPLLEGSALRMKFGLIRERPYEHETAEIARRLDLSPSQAHVLIQSALHRLKLRLKS